MLLNMPNFNRTHYNNIFIFLLFLLETATSYQILSLENDQLCSLKTKQKITLGLHSSSGLVVSLFNSTKLNQHSVDWENDFTCEFQVNTSEIHNGLFAVIQNIALRSNEITNECIDYVEYRIPNGSVGKRFCTQINTDFASDVDATNLTPTINSFVEPTGVLDVYIYISKQHLRPYRKLELEMVFTSYRHCFRNFSQEDKPCSVKYNSHCIYKNFLNDGYVNCPYPGCVDEVKCSAKLHPEDRSNYGFRVAISSLVVILLISAVVALYICRKFKKLCWSDFNIYQRPHVIEINEQPMGQQSNTCARSTEAANLPPSYDSLFPDK